MAVSASATRQRWLREAAAYVVLLILMIWTLGPLYWMVTTSIKTNAEVYGTTATFWPRQPTLANYRILFTKTPFAVYFQNSALIALATTFITVLASALGAYALVRLRFPGRRLLARLLVYTYLVPQSLLFIPLFTILVNAGLSNTRTGLVLTYLGFTVPFCTWLLMGFFKSLPREVEESAMVDGCSRVGAIWRMVLPLSVPGLLTVVIFALTLVIQEFVYSLTFISSVERMTVSVGVPVALVRGDVYYWGSLMAACLITSIPIAVLYNFFLDRFIAGFTVGAIR